MAQKDSIIDRLDALEQKVLELEAEVIGLKATDQLSNWKQWKNENVIPETPPTEGEL